MVWKAVTSHEYLNKFIFAFNYYSIVSHVKFLEHSRRNISIANKEILREERKMSIRQLVMRICFETNWIHLPQHAVWTLQWKWIACARESIDQMNFPLSDFFFGILSKAFSVYSYKYQNLSIKIETGKIWEVKKKKYSRCE